MLEWELDARDKAWTIPPASQHEFLSNVRVLTNPNHSALGKQLRLWEWHGLMLKRETEGRVGELKITQGRKFKTNSILPLQFNIINMLFNLLSKYQTSNACGPSEQTAIFPQFPELEMSSFVLVVTAQMRSKHSKLRPAYNSLTLNTVYRQTCNLSSSLPHTHTWKPWCYRGRKMKERLVESALIVQT